MPLKLISTDTQQEVRIGDTVASFRGELATVLARVLVLEVDVSHDTL